MMRDSSRGYTNNVIKRINRCRILDAVRLHAPISRAEIAAITGLDRKSITNYATTLLREGLLREIGTRSNERGPSSILMELSPEYGHCLGIALQRGHAIGLTIGINGAISRTKRLEYPGKSAVAVARTVEELVKYLSREAAGPALGVGVVLPAGLHTASSLVRRSVNIPQLNGIRLPELLPSTPALGYRFENSARAKALAEKWFGLGKDKSHFACIDLSDGVGCGLIHDSHLFHSPGDFTGEIGHLVVEPYGRVCDCGNLGCLEAYVGESALRESLAHAGASADAVYRQCGSWLGRGLAPIVNILNPSIIIINGSLSAHADSVLPGIWETLCRFSLSDCWKDLEILFSAMPHSDAVGAACLVLSEIFEYDVM